MANRTEILHCNCKHEFQDETYGPGLRVHNVNDDGKAYCTVCSPSYRRNKQGTTVPASSVFGHGTVVSRNPRNPKSVTK